MFVNVYTNMIADFIRSIGIEITVGEIQEETFLPGIKLENGKIVIDEKKLLYPGDLLHEAGHLAVKIPSQRNTTYINAGGDPAEEMMAMAWSYAAAVKIGIPPEVVFHPDGYKGDAEPLLYSFKSGSGVGLPMLQWVGMCYDSKRAPEAGVEPFPNMIKWLREEF